MGGGQQLCAVTFMQPISQKDPEKLCKFKAESNTFPGPPLDGHMRPVERGRGTP